MIASKSYHSAEVRIDLQDLPQGVEIGLDHTLSPPGRPRFLIVRAGSPESRGEAEDLVSRALAQLWEACSA